MRAVAQELGAGPASLYRYVGTRDELVELMADQVAGEIAYPPPSGHWLDDLLGLARRSRELYLRHPWLLDATAPRTPLGPNAVDYLERALAVLAGLAVDAQTKLEAVGVLNAVVAALTRAELDRRGDGQTIPQWQRAQQEYLTQIVAAGRHPHLAAGLAAAGPVAAHEPAEDLFDRLVARVLRGLLHAAVA